MGFVASSFTLVHRAVCKFLRTVSLPHRIVNKIPLVVFQAARKGAVEIQDILLATLFVITTTIVHHLFKIFKLLSLPICKPLKIKTPIHSLQGQ
jgi:hypothetical protein